MTTKYDSSLWSGIYKYLNLLLSFVSLTGAWVEIMSLVCDPALCLTAAGCVSEVEAFFLFMPFLGIELECFHSGGAKQSGAGGVQETEPWRFHARGVKFQSAFCTGMKLSDVKIFLS